MENPEEVLQLLERFTKLKQKEIPRELDDYLSFVARTGDTVYRWAIVKHLFREKLVHVITDFRDNTPSIADLPQCPNVDPFNYERTRRILLDRLDAFNSAPFTVQRICELLTEPRKQYTRIDKFMRAVEKNILVVSTQEPGRRRSDSENGDSLDSIVNGELEVNVDIEMDNEAFAGNEATEIAANSIKTTTSAPTITSSEESSSVSTTPKPDESKDTEATVACDIATDTKTEIGTECKAVSEDSTAATSEELESGVSAKCPVTDSSDATNLPEDGPEQQTSGIVTVEEKADSVALVSTGTDQVTVEESQPLDLIQPAPKELNPSDELHPITESVDKNDEIIEESKPEADACAISADLTQQSAVEDGQSQAKIAKFSYEDEPKTGESKADSVKESSSQVTSDDMLSTEKDDTSSGSTTDSGSSSTSVDSEPILGSTDVSASNSAETVEPFGSIVNNLQTAATVVDPVNDIPSDNESKEIVDVALQTIEPSETLAVVPVDTPAMVKEPAALDSTTKPADLATPADEMETAVSSALGAENVMATDEEETIQSPTDAVVPMAADVPEITKSDDNAMDVDESSVEPMDQ